ncbi:glycoside hydrolase family 66 protein [[Bacillus] enclensis]|uniref:glycoside hydrolase family 66 protein n=1 Tax=[Bacillus] enclensis TaxID=1402860 RepID=UPI0018DB364D|nr:glycoside hydrolase family 66 protein [[Bacillus] enclensis]MBH9966109.1 glycoside hydrolase family 66 protein [[Bacillus] enclensis]
MGKKKSLAVLASMSLTAALLFGCMNSNSEPVFQAETIQQGKWVKQLTADKAAYAPGDSVKLSLSLNEKVEEGKILVQYKHLDETVKEEEIDLKGQDISWSWSPKKDDFKGYMVEVYVKQGDEVIDHQNIGVDVSSDWAKFPRYGYLADFFEMEADQQEDVIDKLNRYHINGLQFYDWQYKHEKPLKIEDGKVAETWPDIANREVSRETIERYISLAHEKNMKAMNYNLLFGSYENAESEGVKKEWGLFKDPDAEEQDKHPLPDNWASDIYLMDPSNKEWQDFIINEEKQVFDHLDFDGWHVDQLGDRGVLWNAKGKTVDLSATYVPFLKEAKQELGTDLVMNAVSQYAQGYIASRAPVSFLYSELWDGHKTYSSLKGVIDQNSKYSKGKLNTILAAYMNYDLSDSMGEFNTPGVLMTNAVIFASGGAHLELGENMLSKEYFPHKKLSMSEELNTELTRYYDFLVAYQNLLRDGGEETEKEVKVKGDLTVSDQPKLGSVWSFSKKKEDKQLIHLINFTDAASLEWRDNQGTQPEPEEKKDIEVEVKVDGKADKVWVATPDAYQGSPVEIDFKQKGDSITFTVPSLKYWDMVVIDYK